MAGTRFSRGQARAVRRHTQHPGVGGGVVSTLGVAAGYGLAISAIVLFTFDRMFGARSSVGRLAILAMSVGALVAGAAVVRVLRSLQRRR